MPRVAVIVPHFNLGKYLHETVNSVLQQTYCDIEVIVVDDGSTEEESISALDSIADPRSMVIRTKNQGVAAARNTGIAQTDAELIICLDADDLLEPTYISKALRIFDGDRSTAIGLVTSWYRLFGTQQAIMKPSKHNPCLMALGKRKPHGASMFRRRCWEEAEGYRTDLVFAEDAFFWISIVAKGYRWALIEEALFCYRVRNSARHRRRRPIFWDRTIVEAQPEFFAEGCKDWLLSAGRQLVRGTMGRSRNSVASSKGTDASDAMENGEEDLLQYYKHFLRLSALLFGLLPFGGYNYARSLLRGFRHRVSPINGSPSDSTSS